MKYVVELKPTQRMGEIKDKLYLKWIKNDQHHIVVDEKEAKQFRRDEIKKLKERFGERIVLHRVK